MSRTIHNSDLDKLRKETERFDSSDMFWKQHATLVLPPLPPNFHGPAPLPPADPEEGFA